VRIPGGTMTKRVAWKYTIDVGHHAGVTEFQIPEGARFMHCASQHDAMCMWFEVPVGETRTVQRGFLVVGTGDPAIQEHMTYVGTGMFADGRFVFHVYEVDYS
jgi:hypothetical protein